MTSNNPFPKGHKINLGRKQSEETRRKISLGLMGRQLSAESRAKIGMAHLGNKWGVGHHPSEELKKRWSEQRLGNKSSSWKGDKVGYSQLHKWIRKYKGRPLWCSFCGSTMKIQWANINHDYKRDLDGWMALCISCHIKYDERERNGKGQFV